MKTHLAVAVSVYIIPENAIALRFTKNGVIGNFARREWPA